MIYRLYDDGDLFKFVSDFKLNLPISINKQNLSSAFSNDPSLMIDILDYTVQSKDVDKLIFILDVLLGVKPSRPHFEKWDYISTVIAEELSIRMPELLERNNVAISEFFVFLGIVYQDYLSTEPFNKLTISGLSLLKCSILDDDLDRYIVLDKWFSSKITAPQKDEISKSLISLYYEKGIDSNIYRYMKNSISFTGFNLCEGLCKRLVAEDLLEKELLEYILSFDRESFVKILIDESINKESLRFLEYISNLNFSLNVLPNELCAAPNTIIVISCFEKNKFSLAYNFLNNGSTKEDDLLILYMFALGTSNDELRKIILSKVDLNNNFFSLRIIKYFILGYKNDATLIDISQTRTLISDFIRHISYEELHRILSKHDSDMDVDLLARSIISLNLSNKLIKELGFTPSLSSVSKI